MESTCDGCEISREVLPRAVSGLTRAVEAKDWGLVERVVRELYPKLSVLVRREHESH